MYQETGNQPTAAGSEGGEGGGDGGGGGGGAGGGGGERGEGGECTTSNKVATNICTDHFVSSRWSAEFLDEIEYIAEIAGAKAPTFREVVQEIQEESQEQVRQDYADSQRRVALYRQVCSLHFLY